MESTCGDTWRDSEERYGESFSNVLQPFCTACAAQAAGRDDDRRRRLDRARGTPRSLVRPKGAASGERATDSPLGGRDDVDSEDDKTPIADLAKACKCIALLQDQHRANITSHAYGKDRNVFMSGTLVETAAALVTDFVGAAAAQAAAGEAGEDGGVEGNGVDGSGKGGDGSDGALGAPRRDVWYRCRKCRTPVFSAAMLETHEVGRGQAAFRSAR